MYCSQHVLALSRKLAKPFSAQSSSIANISCLKRERFEKAEHEKDHIDLYFAQKII